MSGGTNMSVHKFTFTEEVAYLKKKEFLFIAGLFALSLALCAFVYLVPRGDYGSIHITVGGEDYGTYSLAENQTIPIGDTNVCEIKDGKARMISADCPDHLCMHQPAITSAGGIIVCLPNRVVIKGESAKNAENADSAIDAVV